MAGTQLRVVRTQPEIDNALTVLAYYGGNSVRASKELGISDATLRDWRIRTHRERYLAIAEREAPRLEALAAQQSRELIMRAADAEHNVLDRLAATDDDTTAKELSELAGALQRLTTSRGISTTKLLELTGRPTQIVEHRDPRQDAIALAKQLGVTFDSTAVEEPISDSALPTESHEANARGTTVQPDRTT